MYHLEKFTREDIPQLISWIPDAKTLLIWSGSGYDWPIDRDQLEQTLLKANNSNSKYLLLKFLLDKSVVGYIELRKLDSDEKTARIGRVIIDPKIRGRGLGKEIINTVEAFVFSNNPDDELFSVRFSLVGENQGNYILSSINAISNIYEYVEPVAGIPQGNYEPIVQLIAPTKLQIAVVNGSYKPTEKTTVNFEIAGSKIGRAHV